MRFLCMFFLILTLNACVSMKPVRDVQNLDDHVVFSMNARMGVQYVENNQDKSLTGKIQWEDTGRATDVILASPLGTAIASLNVTQQNTTLKTSTGEVYIEKTPEALLYRLLGYELPLSNLRQMIGVSNKHLPELVVYNDWEIKVVTRYANQNLAKKLLMTRQIPTKLTMTLFIDERSDAPNE